MGQILGVLTWGHVTGALLTVLWILSADFTWRTTVLRARTVGLGLVAVLALTWLAVWRLSIIFEPT